MPLLLEKVTRQQHDLCKLTGFALYKTKPHHFQLHFYLPPIQSSEFVHCMEHLFDNTTKSGIVCLGEGDMKVHQVHQGFFKSEDLDKVYANYDELMAMPHGTHKVPVWERQVVVSHPPKGNRVRVEHLGDFVVVAPGEIVGIAAYEIWKIPVFNVNNDPIRDLLKSLNLEQVEIVWTDEGLVDLVPEFCANTFRLTCQKRAHQTRKEYHWECPMGGSTRGNMNTEGVYWILWQRLCSGKKAVDVTPIKLVMRSEADPYQVILSARKRLSLPYPEGR